MVSRRAFLLMTGALGLTTAGCGGSTPTRTAAPSAVSPGAAPVTAPAPDGVLAANFNGDPAQVTDAELRSVSATWLRGFFTMSDADDQEPAEAPAIATLLSAAGRGYGTVLSLKFSYEHQAIPAPGSSAMATAGQRLAKVLGAVLGKVDILVIGNEPFIECRDEDRAGAQLNEFYETLAQQAIAYREQHPAKTRLYMGALNHLDQPEWRTSATERWMTFVRTAEGIDGTDMHPHLPAVDSGPAYLDYVAPRLRADQKFLATEFSLVLFWKKHLTDPIAPAFAKKYGVASGTPVWQVVKDAIANPFPQAKWTDFLSMSPWFAEHRNFLADQVGKFRDTGRLAVAAYGVAQDTPMIDGFSKDSPPWLFNSLFCPYTVQPAANGLPGQTTPWVDQFRTLQHP